MNNLIEKFKEIGFTVVNTGSGCMAFERILPHGYILINRECELPTSEADEVQVGIYTGTDELVVMMSVNCEHITQQRITFTNE